MKKKSKQGKPTAQATSSGSASPPSPVSMDEKPSAAGTSPTPPPKALIPLAMDSTAHIEISFMENDKYSQEIINDARNVVNLEKLRGLKGDKNKFYEEAKIQINKLFQSITALKTHTDLFHVTFLIHLGYVLNEIRPTFQKRSGYVNWRRHNIPGYTQEYFQHAHRLAGMGHTAIKYRSLGVSRLLDVERLERATGRSLDDILKEHSFLDTVQDFGGELFKARVDAVISYHRFKKAGVDKIPMEQAFQLAQYSHKAVEVREVNRFKKKYDEASDKDAFLDKYVLNKMALTEDGEAKAPSGESLNNMLAGLNSYFEIRTNDSDWLTYQKAHLDPEIFAEAYGHLTWLKKNLRRPPHKASNTAKKRRR